MLINTRLLVKKESSGKLSDIKQEEDADDYNGTNKQRSDHGQYSNTGH